MNRFPFRAVLAVVLFSLLSACQPGQPIRLDEAQNGETVLLQTGQSLIVSLKSNPSTGFGWYQAEASGPVLVMEGEPVFVAGEGAELAGAPGRQELTFVAGRPGAVTLKLVYGRAWATDAPAEKHYQLQVRVE
ncbi:protease inhibitor I42 family protein [Marinobacter hydrocarbonoclasticus]|nr:protease inhibitor I42 family protein [Marinobacter nauticus]